MWKNIATSEGVTFGAASDNNVGGIYCQTPKIHENVCTQNSQAAHQQKINICNISFFLIKLILCFGIIFTVLLISLLTFVQAPFVLMIFVLPHLILNFLIQFLRKMTRKFLLDLLQQVKLSKGHLSRKNLSCVFKSKLG